MLHIPKLNVFITSPLDSDIDVHALGGQKHTFEGIWNGILSRDCVYHTAVIGVHPHSMPLNNSFAILTRETTRLAMSMQWVFH